MAAATGFTLWAVEVALGVIDRLTPAPQQTRLDAFGDTRTKLEVILDLRDEGFNAHAAIFPNAFLDSRESTALGHEIYPLGSISNVSTVLCKRGDTGEYVIYGSDKHGFNNPAETWLESNLDVMLIGDSFTLGHCVLREESIAGRLRESGHSALALGMSENGPLIELGTLAEYGPALKPSVVLWMFYEGNDLKNLDFEKDNALIRGYMESNFSQGLLDRQSEIDQLLKRYETEQIAARQSAELQTPQPLPGFVSRAWRRVVSVATLSRLRARLASRLRPKRLRMAPPELLRDILERSLEVVRGWNGQLVFVYLPHQARYVPGGRIDDHQLQQRDVVLSLVADLEIPILDIDGVFAGHPDPVTLFVPMNEYRGSKGKPRVGLHYSPYGYRVVAAAIEERVLSIRTSVDQGGRDP